MIQEKIKQLKQMIIAQANDVENMLAHFKKGLFEKDKEILVRLVEVEETNLNNNEIIIDRHCAEVLARFRPEATDLRFVFMVSRMNTDLERMGDHCVNMTESALFFLENPVSTEMTAANLADSIDAMLTKAQAMLTDCISAFINEDVTLAENICSRDREIDELNESIYRQIITMIQQKTSRVETFLHLIRIVNNIEKLADLTTNIAEEVIYISTGVNIKHSNHEDLMQQL